MTTPPYPTEAKCPEQCAEFRKIINEMYVLHLSKNQDYSPMNMLGTGMVGVIVRIWDKTARLMNLGGFDIRRGELKEKNVEPQHESIEDSLIDLANYAIIGLILLRKKWGK